MTADYRGGATLYASSSVEIETAATSSTTPVRAPRVSLVIPLPPSPRGETEPPATPSPTPVRAPRVSIVIPVLDEEKTIEPLYHGIVEAVDNAGLAAEMIFVDDGSTDRTFEILSRLHDHDDR